MTRRRLTRLAATALIVACATSAGAVQRRAQQPDRFDGTWSVEVLTESGTCDRAYRYPVKIEHGRARFIGTAFVVQGSVAGNGAIRGSISNGSATADVTGRLGPEGFGKGTWSASGALECRGRWNAERRG
ncbi:hypothetical protein [Methylobacterium sp. NEAU K]|uniref:hypothetical protein n=1 Tax=Methylobacterium sp. NEAU K TaxID=3064946 RepID=UPI0027346BBE|nr:hypothetical protein [Methylobacterium sp. NEAU K]MDP4002432.1 hypothetical protein [Methylobacterium sp. NEAU K]